MRRVTLPKSRHLKKKLLRSRRETWEKKHLLHLNIRLNLNSIIFILVFERFKNSANASLIYQSTFQVFKLVMKECLQLSFPERYWVISIDVLGNSNNILSIISKQLILYSIILSRYFCDKNISRRLLPCTNFPKLLER